MIAELNAKLQLFRLPHRPTRWNPSMTMSTEHYGKIIDGLFGRADLDRPLLRGPDRGEAARYGPRRGADRHRRFAGKGVLQLLHHRGYR